MKIVLENVPFEYDLGCKLLKLKGGESPFEELSDIWNDIKELSFGEIAQLTNLEQRRIAVNYMGIDRLVKEIKPTLLDSQTLEKTTTWINEKGVMETIKFSDTYELYEVTPEMLFGEQSNSRFNARRDNQYYIRCKDTSTDREYLIWVDINAVHRTNGGNEWNMDKVIEQVNAIQCIAWTIMTDVPQGNIEKILRQGDCILVKPKNNSYLKGERHLTEEEYKTLLEIES
jgi:hypothetical protein